VPGLGGPSSVSYPAQPGFRSGYLGVSQLQMIREPAWN